MSGAGLIPVGVADALIAAGGCVHEPEPQKACNVCARHPAGWSRAIRLEGSIPYRFRATLLDGQVIEQRAVLSTANLPLDRVVRIEVLTSDHRFPLMSISVDPSKGEQLRVFTCRVVKIAAAQIRAEDGGIRKNLSIPVFEVRFDPADEKRFVRLYLHPDRPILTTEELRF